MAGAGGLKLLLRCAESAADVLRCRRLIAEVYNRDYEVVFSEDHFDLAAKVEPWPHRFLMALHAEDLVAACGIYTHNTYVGRFGQISENDLRRTVAEADAAGLCDLMRHRELTKLSVRHEWRGRDIAPWLLGAAHSRHFTEVDRDNAVMVFCAKLSIIENLYNRAGLRTRRIKEFPFYKVHELYHSAEDPMESRLMIPALDIPQRWYELALPGEYAIERLAR
jgi:GNAT superfamily N-acetyltransferase